MLTGLLTAFGGEANSGVQLDLENPERYKASEFATRCCDCVQVGHIVGACFVAVKYILLYFAISSLFL